MHSTACKWTLRESGVQAVAQPIAAHQVCEKLWSLHGSTPGMLPWIRKIHVSCPGFVFVSTVQGNYPIVRASSESEVAVQAVGVKLERDGKLCIRTKKSLYQHFLLIEVVLPVPHSVKKIKSLGSAAVVVEDHVMVANQPEEKTGIKLTGSGTIFVNSQTEIHAKRFKATLTGSGNIQLTTPSIVLHDKLEATVVSSGQLRVFAGNVYATKVELTTTGSGELQLSAFNYQGISKIESTMVGSGVVRVVGDSFQATKYEASSMGSGKTDVVFKDELEIQKLECNVNGSGDIRFGCNKSSCGIEEIGIHGSGSVDLHDVVAARAKVEIYGSGNAKFRALEEVKCEHHGSGQPILHGNAPQRMTGSVNFQPLEPTNVDRLMSEQSQMMVPPTRSDAFQFCIQAGVFSSIATEMFGVFRNIWRDLTVEAGNAAARATAAPAGPAHAQSAFAAAPPPPMKTEGMPPAAAVEVAAAPATFAGPGVIPTAVPIPTVDAQIPNSQIPAAIPVAMPAPSAYPGPSKRIP